MQDEARRCPFGCILAMPHVHGDALVSGGRTVRQLSRWERFLFENFWLAPREMRGR